jgi:hypothetical protein
VELITRELLGLELMLVGIHLLEHSGDGFTSLLEVSLLVGLDTIVEILEGVSEVIFHVIHEFRRSELHVRGVGKGSFADGLTLLELLIGSKGSDATGKNVLHGVFLVTRELMVGLHELLDTKIEYEGSLVLLIDTLKEIEQVELEAVHLGESLEQLGDLVGSRVFLLDATKEDLGRGLSNVFTESLPVASFVLGDAIINLTININTIDLNILTNMPDKRGQVLEVADHVLQDTPVIFEMSTGDLTIFDIDDHICKHLEPMDNIVHIMHLEVRYHGL